MLASGPIVQSGGGKVHHNRVLNFHITDSGHEQAFDPVIRKGERMTLVVFGHGILAEQVRGQTCDRQQLRGLRQKRASVHVQLRF